MTKLIIIVLALVVVGGIGVLAFGGGEENAEQQSSSLDNHLDTTGAIVQETDENTDSGSVSDEQFDKAPAFTLEDYQGNEVSLSDFDGKVRIVNSWAVWCPFCVDELPDFARLQQEFGDKIVVIAVDRAESLAKAKGFSDSLGISDDMTFLLDPRDSFYRSIGGFSMPETLFVDGSGNIRIHKRGPMEFAEMKEKVESIIN